MGKCERPLVRSGVYSHDKFLWINTEPFNPVRWPAMGIHGDKSQQERDWVLNGKLASLIFTCF